MLSNIFTCLMAITPSIQVKKQKLSKQNKVTFPDSTLIMFDRFKNKWQK